jgi:hypothetical protein
LLFLPNSETTSKALKPGQQYTEIKASNK